jgi:periplasmic protein CpxP/Spy
MKKVFLVLVFLVGISSFAQGKKKDRSAMSSEKLTEMHVNKLKKDLALTDAQVASITELHNANAKKREERMAKLKQMRTDSKKLTPEEKEALKKEMEEKNMETEEQMKAILTPDQFTKWQAQRAKHKEKIMEKRASKE